MTFFYNKKLKDNSQKLRLEITKEERHLWYDFLKSLPVTIHRQKTIGNYIVDFYCASAKIVIELDGSQHYENNGKQKDIARDEYFRQLGVTVLRYSNDEISSKFEAVCKDIWQHLNLE